MVAEGTGPAPTIDSWESRRTNVRFGGGLQTVLSFLLFGAFALPWVTVSCDTARTRELSGFDLALGADPDIRASAESRDHEDVLEVVDGLRGAAVLLFMELLLLAALAGLMTWTGAAPLAAVAAVVATMLAHGFVAFGVASMDRVLGPETHHHGGLFAASALAALTCVVALGTAASSRWGLALEHDQAPNRLAWWTVGAILSTGVIFGLALAAESGPLAVVALVAALVASLPLWGIAAWLTFSEPTLRAGIVLAVAGIPLAIGGGALLAG
jgi:hypothetical protein